MCWVGESMSLDILSLRYFCLSLIVHDCWKVMLKSGKYEQLHNLFTKMKKSGETLKANTYRGIFICMSSANGCFWTLDLIDLWLWHGTVVLVKAFWEEGNADGAIEAVRDMEQRGVVGSASVYYELACCLCYNGKWQDALVEVGSPSIYISFLISIWLFRTFISGHFFI